MAHGPRYTHLATAAYIAEDKESEWSAEDVAFGKYDALFEAVTDPVANLNFTTSTFWVKFKITNGTRETHDYFIETARPLTNVVNLYRIGSHGAQLLYATGDEKPFTHRPVVYRKFVFPITLKPSDSLNLMFQLRSDGEVISLPIKLWETNNFNAFVQRENLTLGLYYGLLIFVTGLFLFFAFIVRQRIYTYYVSYVVFLFFMQASLDGLAYEYFWPQSPWIANHSILFFSGSSVFMIMLYAAEFLQLNTLAPWFNATYKAFQWLVFVCIVTGLTSGAAYEWTYPAINGLSLISLLLIIAGIGLRYKQEKSINVFFTLGFISVLAGGIVFIFTNFNLIFSDFLSQNAIKLGSAAEVTFLSMAMVGRYRDIQREKEAAQQEAFANLQKLNDLVKQQNIILEKEVEERTAEIKEKSRELEVKNQEIIDSITYAKRIQQAILPPEHFFHKHLPDSFVAYLPKDIVAGDFYWMETRENSVIFAAADCTGHGVPGALVSVVCHNALNRSVREFDLKTPSDILDQTAIIVDETFEKSTQEVKDGMDISICSISLSSRTLNWAGANNPLWIICKTEKSGLGSPAMEENGFKLYEIKADKQPIGRYPNRSKYTNHEVQLEPDDRIFIFSDGFADQFGGENGKKYKSKNFKSFLLSIQDHPMDEQKALIIYEFNHWRNKLEQLDDVCVIGVKV